MIGLADVAANIVAEVLVLGGRRLALAAHRVGRSKRTRQSAVEAFFSTQARALAPPGESVLALPADLQDRLGGALADPRLRAVVHELFAVRVAGALGPEPDQLRANLRTLLAPAEPAELADELFAELDARIVAAVAEFGRTHPELLRDIRQDTQLTRINATVAAIERHAAVLAGDGDLAADQRFLDRYRRQVLDFHGKLDPPDFERRRRVPIEEIYVSPTIVPVPSTAEMDAQAEVEELDVDRLTALIDRTVLLGDPGGGKTTTSHVLMHRLATDPRRRRVPFFVTVREFAAQDPPARSVVGHIEHVLETFYHCPPPAGLLERLFLHGMAMVVFDGLDELVDTGRRADVAAVVERFGTEYPLTAVVVTSRWVGYDQARLDESQFACFRLRGFDDARVAEYVRKWFRQEDRMTLAERDRSAEDFLASSRSVGDLRTNPLMLSLMCILYRGEGSIPQNRPEIYEQCSALLLRRWDNRRRIHTDLRAGSIIEAVLRHLAYWLFTEKGSEPVVTEEELVAETTRILDERGFDRREEAAAAARELVAFCRGRAWVFSDAGVTARGETLYAFTHRTFMEYFAAAHLAGRYDSPAQLARRLAPRIARHEWDVVAQLAVQIKDRTADQGAERFFTTLLADRRRSVEGRQHLLGFLGRCLAFSRVPTRIVRELTRESVEFAFRPNEYGSTRLSALGWVMHSGNAYVDVIREEIDAALAERIPAGDRADRCYSLKLALSLGDLPWITSEPEERIYGPRHWDELAVTYVQTHIDAIAELAPYDLTLAAEAFLQRRLDVGDFLDWHGPDLTNLIRSIPHLKYRSKTRHHSYYRYRPLVSELLGSPGLEGDDVAAWRQWVVARLTSLGEVLRSLPDPPWVDAGAEDMDMDCLRYFPELPQSALAPIDGPALAAAGVLVFVCAEVETDVGALTGLVASTPHLAVFAPYLERRDGRLDGELRPLPVEERFATLFRAWADGEMDLTRR